MSYEKGFGQADPALARYAEEVFAPEDAALADVRARAEAAEMPPIHVGRMDGLHLEVLTRVSGAKKAVEVGTLAGYSGLAILRGMGSSGFLHTFEYSPDHAKVAEETFRKNGFGDRARVHVGPALSHLHEIERDGPFDLVFIDADKEGYPDYLAWAERNLRVGGLVIGDNTFAFGRVASGDRGADVLAIRAFNERLARGGRFRATILPTEEGLTVGVKIG
jgi:caffeoyl-CoA O-methyltransferase